MSPYTPGKKALVTTDGWFLAPDGKQYRAVFGTVRKIHSDADTLGIKTNIRSTNWFLEIGNMCIAGCQIHYAIATETCELGDVPDVHVEAGKVTEFTSPARIYDADQGAAVL